MRCVPPKPFYFDGHYIFLMFRWVLPTWHSSLLRYLLAISLPQTICLMLFGERAV